MTELIERTVNARSEGKGKDSQDKNRGTDEEILKLFYEVDSVHLEGLHAEDVVGRVCAEDVVDAASGASGSGEYARIASPAAGSSSAPMIS